MDKRNLKTYEQYITDYKLSKGFDVSILNSQIIDNAYKSKYAKLYLDYLLMKDVVDDNTNTNESLNDVILSIYKNDFENDPNKFFDSYNKSKRLVYLTPYTINDLKNFKLFKIKGYDIGFAIKRNNEIILVHNNENIKGIGDLIVKKAIEFGGDQLDHFDGYLTGFYKRNGFNFFNNNIFDEKYKPKKWEYEKINIYNSNNSIYASELKVDAEKFFKAEKRYESGKPDIVYRKLSK